MQKYLDIAAGELGVHETTGAQATARIIEYDACTTLKATSDEVPWCSSFANWVVEMGGGKGTKSAAARSWLDWGKVTTSPQAGDIVVFDRKDKTNPHAAHVAFFVGFIGTDFVRVIGGNQSDMVKYANYPKDKVLGYRTERV
jgi:uncharacterized protein (TIGR02594 family)